LISHRRRRSGLLKIGGLPWGPSPIPNYSIMDRPSQFLRPLGI
jgi:hypothetical protein